MSHLPTPPHPNLAVMPSKILYKRLNYLIQQANHEDTILQSYRGLILTIHALVLACAAALLGAAFQVLGAAAHLNLLTITVCFAAIVSGWTLKGAKAMLRVKERELTYFHKQILEAEKHLPPRQRFFTVYKQFQESNHSVKAAAEFVPDFNFSQIVVRDRTPYLSAQFEGKPPSKRIVMAKQFAMIEITWILIVICSIFAIWLV